MRKWNSGVPSRSPAAIDGSKFEATAGNLILRIAAVLEQPPHKFVDEVVEFSNELARGGEGDPTEKTIRGYLSNQRTKCNHRFAALLLDFIDRKGPGVDRLGDERQLCLSVLRANHNARYERTDLTDPPDESSCNRAIGTYVLLRRETANGYLRQELLLLSKPEGTRAHHATYMTSELIGRGHWGIISRNVCSNVYGNRDNGRRDFITFILEGQIGSPLLVGILSGLTTETVKPVGQVVVAVRVPNDLVGRDFEWIGDMNDAAIERELSSIDAAIQKRLDSIGLKQMHRNLEPIFEWPSRSKDGTIDLGQRIQQFNREFPKPIDVVSTELREFIAGRSGKRRA